MSLDGPSMSEKEFNQKMIEMLHTFRTYEGHDKDRLKQLVQSRLKVEFCALMQQVVLGYGVSEKNKNDLKRVFEVMRGQNIFTDYENKQYEQHLGLVRAQFVPSAPHQRSHSSSSARAAAPNQASSEDYLLRIIKGMTEFNWIDDPKYYHKDKVSGNTKEFFASEEIYNQKLGEDITEILNRFYGQGSAYLLASPSGLYSRVFILKEAILKNENEQNADPLRGFRPLKDEELELRNLKFSEKNTKPESGSGSGSKPRV